jgi:hypothetical protein
MGRQPVGCGGGGGGSFGGFGGRRRAAVKTSVERLERILRRVAFMNEDADAMRAAEGEAAYGYFTVFGDLLRSPDSDVRFNGRSRRPPLDPISALLSFLYTLLTHDCRSAAESVGLDPAVGFLDRDRPGRPSLALDLMEELRPVLADRLALSLGRVLIIRFCQRGSLNVRFAPKAIRIAASPRNDAMCQSTKAGIQCHDGYWGRSTISGLSCKTMFNKERRTSIRPL